MELSSPDQPGLTPARLQSEADAVYAKNMGMNNRWGRPIEGQRVMYSGHKKVHGLKFQAVLAADGMIAHLYGKEYIRALACSVTMSRGCFLKKLSIARNIGTIMKRTHRLLKLFV